MSSDVEEHQEIVDKYYYAPSENKVAAARQLANIEYSRELVKLQRNDRDNFQSFVKNVTNTNLQQISQVFAENVQHRLNDVNIEVIKLSFLGVVNSVIYRWKGWKIYSNLTDKSSRQIRPILRKE